MVIGEHEKLNDIQSLKFYKGSLTTGRRRSPVPQVNHILLRFIVNLLLIFQSDFLASM